MSEKLVLVQYPLDGHLGPAPETELANDFGGVTTITWAPGMVRALPAAAGLSLCHPQNGFNRCVGIAGQTSVRFATDVTTEADADAEVDLVASVLAAPQGADSIPDGATRAVYKTPRGSEVDVVVLDLATRRLFRDAAKAKAAQEGAEAAATKAAEPAPAAGEGAPPPPAPPVTPTSAESIATTDAPAPDSARSRRKTTILAST